MKKSPYQTKNWLEFLRKTDEELLAFCRIDVYKATGHGGQKKNKTSNAIRLVLSHLSVYESKSRSKNENLKGAIKKMRFAIATDDSNFLQNRVQLPEAPEEITPYLNKSEIRINPKNEKFPIFLGYLMNSIIKNEGSWHKVGEDFGTSATQIRRFVEKTPGISRFVTQIKEKQKKIKLASSLPADVSAS
ncbi:peptide chain release factor-like protein [bacterium]|nr:peptide chain release factor-like protein [bacterium]